MDHKQQQVQVKGLLDKKELQVLMVIMVPKVMMVQKVYKVLLVPDLLIVGTGQVAQLMLLDVMYFMRLVGLILQ